MRCAQPRANISSLARASSTANRSRPRQKGVHGYDTHQNVNGRKRHILVDTLGLIIAVLVTAASVQDREGAMSLLAHLRHHGSRLRLIWADQAYTGDLIAWLWALRPWRKIRLEIVMPLSSTACLRPMHTKCDGSCLLSKNG